jgi:hypothetical protein
MIANDSIDKSKYFGLFLVGAIPIASRSFRATNIPGFFSQEVIAGAFRPKSSGASSLAVYEEPASGSSLDAGNVSQKYTSRERLDIMMPKFR